MPKRVKTFRPKQAPTRKEQNAEYDARRAANEIRTQYNTSRWRALRKVILLRDPWCKRCEARSIITPSDTVNHIKKAQEHPELFWDEDNLEGVCAPCHSSEIQSEERQANGREGRGVEG